jgi:hypothetical protein
MTILDIHDDFSTIDEATKWNKWGGNQIYVDANRVRFDSTTNANYYGMDTTGFLSGTLVGSMIMTRLVSAGNQSITSFECYPCGVDTTAGSNGLFWFVGGGNLKAYRKNGGSNTELISTTYDPDVHKWLRIREDAGIAYWDYSTDGITWTGFATYTLGFAVTSCIVTLLIGTWQAEGSTTSMILDNLNLAEASAESLKENFNGADLDTDKWRKTGTEAQIQQVDGKLRITTQTGSAYYDLITKQRFNLVNSYVSVHIPDAGNLSLASREVILYIQQQGEVKYYIDISGTTVALWLRINGSGTSQGSVTYNAATMKFFRLVEFEGVIYADYSADGDSWTNFASDTLEFEVTNVEMALQSGNWDTEASESAAFFDDVNLRPDISYLQDNFNDDSIDTDKWVNTDSDIIQEVDGKLRLYAYNDASYLTLFSKVPYHLTDTSASVKVEQVPDQSIESLEQIFYVSQEDDDDNKVYLTISGNRIQPRKIVSGVNTAIGAGVQFDPAAMRFIRIREAAGNTYWEYSADLSEWTTLASEANPISMEEIEVGLQLGHWAYIDRVDYAYFDNFNYQTPPEAEFRGGNVPLISGHEYKLSFQVRSTKAQQINVKVQDSNNANESTSQYKTIPQNETITAKFEFTAAATDNNSRVRIFPEAGYQDTYFDHFRLIDLTIERKQYRVMRIQGSMLPGSFIQALTLREKTDAETA